jgi:hypothetical protein
MNGQRHRAQGRTEELSCGKTEGCRPRKMNTTKRGYRLAIMNRALSSLERGIETMLATDLAILEQRDRIEAECIEDAYHEGKADGAFGYKPRFINEHYLRGWLAGTIEILKSYPRDRQGNIQYPSPPTSSDPLQWLWDAGDELRAQWGLPKVTTLTPESEF